MNTVTELTADRRVSRWRLALDEVLAVLRLATTLRIDRARVVGRDETFVLLSLAALAVWIVVGRLPFGLPMKPDAAGLPGLATVACAAAALAWLLSRPGNPPVPLRLTLWLVAGYLPAAALALWLLHAPLSRAKLVAVATVFGAHAALYFWFGLRGLSGGRAAPSFATWAGAISAFIVLGQAADFHGSLWSPLQTEAQIAHYRESAQRTESLLYSQPERIVAALDSLDVPGRPGPHAYFLGFAGFGEQRVFAQEIGLAEQRIRQRFGTTGRSLLLVNDMRDYDRHPLASRSGLARALEGIAARMNRDEDVLFLALSSHGKRDPYLVIKNGALPFEQLTPEALAEMLKASRIRWKVLVISACYAGAFIERLSDEHTAILTAAAPGKASFGCNDRRELTYFGEAFYRDALPRAQSLRAAFDTAAAAIAELERRENLVPSEPRAYFGAAIEAKLAELERNRAPALPTATATAATAVPWRP